MQSSAFVNNIFNKYISDEKLKKLLITHSTCVAKKALKVVEDCHLFDQVDAQFLIDASMLHDIGVVECNAPGIYCYGMCPYLQHGLAGAEIVSREGLDPRFADVCRNHIGAGLTAKEIMAAGLPLPDEDFLPQTLEEKLICYADSFFSKSKKPDKEKSLEAVEVAMKRHGDGVLRRFLELEKLFTPHI